jgi:hypothetical protein
VIIAIPIAAFGALKDSRLPEDYPALWQRIQDYTITLERKGIEVHPNLSEDDWRVVQALMVSVAKRLRPIPYPQRGASGNARMSAIATALDRIGKVLDGSRGYSRHTETRQQLN